MMARRKTPQKSGDWLFPNLTTEGVEDQSSLLDVVDNVLNRGAVLNGDVMLGVANVDLIYVRLSVLLAALDKVTSRDPIFRPITAGPNQRRSKRRTPRSHKK
jgi:Gas vesicle protein